MIYAANVEERDEYDWHVVKATLELNSPARADDLLDACVKINRIGRSSLTFDLAIFRPGEKIPAR